LNASPVADKIAVEVANVPRLSGQGISMSPDRHGSGATRIEAVLSIKIGEILMRRASTCLAATGLAVLALSSVASAAPTVTLKAEAVPIPGFKGTGNIYGAGAAFQAEFTIKGTEYGGYPPPLIGVNVYLPKGTVLHPSGFATCSKKAIVEEKEPTKCPKKSKAGPVGKAYGFVVFGNERVPEALSIESFFAPGGGLYFFAAGHTPASIEITSVGRYIHLNGAGGFGPEAVVQVPLVETVPGAPDASVEKIISKVGAAYMKGKTPVYYGRVPKKGMCPKGGFSVKAELTFAGLGGLSEQVVTTTYKAPCPRK
jgi:hypothetical protein